MVDTMWHQQQIYHQVCANIISDQYIITAALNGRIDACMRDQHSISCVLADVRSVPAGDYNSNAVLIIPNHYTQPLSAY